MPKDVSPEEKLLSIIKGKRHGRDNNAAKGEGNDDKAKAAISWEKIDEYVSVILKNSVLKNSRLDPGILKAASKYMLIILALFVLYFILDMFLINSRRQAELAISIASVPEAAMPINIKGAKIEARDYDYYSNRIGGKKLFSGNSAVQAAASADEALGDDISLVGIVPGDNPQAIIEAKKAQKTYYLTKDQAIDDITVEDIDKDKVILDYKGKRLTLFL